MRPVLVVLLLLGLLGCASVPTSDPGSAGENAPKGSSLNRARIYTELAAGYFTRGQYAVTLKQLDVALAAEPNYAPAYHVMGLVRAELREDKQAEEAFRRAITLNPQFSVAQNNYGLFLCQRGRMEEGLASFESALANPLYDSPENALTNAGACALKKGDVAKAEVYYTRALRRAPNLGNALLGMAEVDFRSQRLLAARSKLRQLSDRGDLNAQGLWLGVRVERALGDRAAETSYGTQLKRRFPESMQAQWLLLGQYDMSGDPL
jgi:type IV pilus assembly protein PilF